MRTPTRHRPAASVTRRRTPSTVAAPPAGPTPPTGPTSIAGLRTRLVVLAGLAVAGAAAGISWWAVAALLLTCLAIPVAVAVQGGPCPARALFFLPSRPHSTRHRPERTNHDARLRPSGRTPAHPG
ncbi:hypothetical protein [Micromonospora sp. NPDC004704]